MTLICQNQACGESFEGRPNRAYCSPSCKAAINNRRYIESDKYARELELMVRANRKILSKLYQVFGSETLDKSTIEKSRLNTGYRTSTSADGTHYFFLDFIIKWLSDEHCQILKMSDLQ